MLLAVSNVEDHRTGFVNGRNGCREPTSLPHAVPVNRLLVSLHVQVLAHFSPLSYRPISSGRVGQFPATPLVGGFDSLNAFSNFYSHVLNLVAELDGIIKVIEHSNRAAVKQPGPFGHEVIVFVDFFNLNPHFELIHAHPFLVTNYNFVILGLVIHTQMWLNPQ